jgi:hypothetical protein
MRNQACAVLSDHALSIAWKRHAKEKRQIPYGRGSERSDTPELEVTGD